MEARESNREAWNGGAYSAWVNRFGTPEQAAERLKDNPVKSIQHLYKYFEEQVQGKSIMNLMGSNGIKGVALALLGAKVTVADFSYENQQYAEELARAAGVELRYVLSDVLQLPEEEFLLSYDTVFMENGILHYFKNLKPLFDCAARLLKPGGRLVVQDFHPISTKLISSSGTTAKIRKHKVTGDYFSTSLEASDVSFQKYLNSGENSSSNTVYLRKWTLGEIVTAVAESGLRIMSLEEMPNLSSEVYDKGIPKTFTIVAERIGS
ncbi:S-adenosylmethionine-dependent methyltransferase [Paenibacillus sp. J23TS9]|uniref:class I SAM-dependent methyltransferase n=1 Tax=Paenibacillus sp. J23TS9 TaxID=2807193 RepID=UPI001B0F0A3A|nr:class I SAM-dependent methyltransferase [Paenibacillus sp. J23TS9]GIP29598.1 S-adenosylmethionine-dependent methyltransferase [Paenibacillus sp. J23TS9]